MPRTSYGLGLASIALAGHITVWGMIGTMFGSQTATFATRDRSHGLTANINADWAQGPWDDPSDILTELLAIEFGT